MQLSASTLPLDPNSLLPGFSAPLPGGGAPETAPLTDAGTFGAMLLASTPPAAAAPTTAPAVNAFAIGISVGAPRPALADSVDTTAGESDSTDTLSSSDDPAEEPPRDTPADPTLWAAVALVAPPPAPPAPRELASDVDDAASAAPAAETAAPTAETAMPAAEVSAATPPATPAAKPSPRAEASVRRSEIRAAYTGKTAPRAIAAPATEKKSAAADPTCDDDSAAASPRDNADDQPSQSLAPAAAATTPPPLFSSTPVAPGPASEVAATATIPTPLETSPASAPAATFSAPVRAARSHLAFAAPAPAPSSAGVPPALIEKTNRDASSPLVATSERHQAIVDMPAATDARSVFTVPMPPSARPTGAADTDVTDPATPPDPTSVSPTFSPDVATSFAATSRPATQVSPLPARPAAAPTIEPAARPVAPLAASFVAPLSATPAASSVAPAAVTSPLEAAASAAGDVTLLEFTATTASALPADANETDQEKFAVAPDRTAKVAATLRRTGIKNFLNADGQAVTESSRGLGIGVAKTRPAMPVLAPAQNRPTSDSASLPFSAPVLDFAALADEQPQPAVMETSNAARRTVESVLAVTDHFTTGGTHGVNLKFSVSGIDLAVRVEVRGGHVQATFRTDSPELREALATEWRAVAAESGDRGPTLAEPVFTSASSSRGGLQADAGGSDQRGSSARQEAPVLDEFAAARSSFRRLSPAAATSPAPAAARTPHAAPGRLHVLA